MQHPKYPADLFLYWECAFNISGSCLAEVHSPPTSSPPSLWVGEKITGGGFREAGWGEEHIICFSDGGVEPVLFPGAGARTHIREKKMWERSDHKKSRRNPSGCCVSICFPKWKALLSYFKTYKTSSDTQRFAQNQAQHLMDRVQALIWGPTGPFTEESPAVASCKPKTPWWKKMQSEIDAKMPQIL